MNLNIDLLQYQKCSQEALTAAMREMKSGKMIPSWEDMKAFLKKNLGFWEQIKITPREELELFDKLHFRINCLFCSLFALVENNFVLFKQVASFCINRNDQRTELFYFIAP